MRFIAIPILILLVMTQTFSKWFVVMSFQLNRAYIAKNLCENRYRPQLKCGGNCVLMKKMRQEEKQEKNAPGPVKIEISTIVLSSKSFFVTIDYIIELNSKSYLPVFNTGKPVDRTSPVFHPPSA